MATRVASGARLDMDHGFVKFIRKIQVDRDNYNEEVKNPGKKGGNPNRPTSVKKRPDLPVYKHPHHSKLKMDPVYAIDFEDENGQSNFFEVYPDCTPETVAHRIRAALRLPVRLHKPLLSRLHEEMEKLDKKHNRYPAK